MGSASNLLRRPLSTPALPEPSDRPGWQKRNLGLLSGRQSHCKRSARLEVSRLIGLSGSIGTSSQMNRRHSSIEAVPASNLRLFALREEQQQRQWGGLLLPPGPSLLLLPYHCFCFMPAFLASKWLRTKVSVGHGLRVTTRDGNDRWGYRHRGTLVAAIRLLNTT